MPIINEAAYEAATKRRIAANRRIGGERRFRAAFEDAQVLINFINGRVSDAQVAHVAKTEHSMENASFIDACWYSLSVFGGLTEKQALAVRSIIAKNAERKAQERAEALTKVHVGTVGERRDFDLTVKFITFYDTHFGTKWVHIMNDDDGNILVYKGTAGLYNADKNHAEKGDRVSFKATIKSHDERDGVKQTILSRPAQKL